MRSSRKLRADWQYVVVEEVVGSTVELMRWPWPLADDWGRLFWTPDAEEHVMTAGVPQRSVRLQLYRPNQLLRRPRAGDTFGARISSPAPGWAEDRLIEDLAELFPGPLYDVSAEACDVLVSSTGGGRYNFPHALAMDAAREARQATTSSSAARLTDHRSESTSPVPFSTMRQ